MGKNEAMNLADLLSESAGRHPEKKALLIPGSPGRAPVTYQQLDAEVDRVAASIQALGLAPGDRVAIAMHNVPEFLFAYFGTLRAGAVVVPGSRAIQTDKAREWGLSLYAPVIVKYRDERTDASTMLEEALR